MSITLIIQALTAILQLAPLGIETVAGIKKLLANDPAVPPDLKAILQGTLDDNAATLARVQAWIASHPE